jgi:hypothetical protein
MATPVSPGHGTQGHLVYGSPDSQSDRVQVDRRVRRKQDQDGRFLLKGKRYLSGNPRHRQSFEDTT